MSKHSLVDRECDFCGQIIEEDEELVPIYVGDPPQPNPAIARGTSPKQRKRVGYNSTVNDTLEDDIEVLGRPADELAAIIKALERSDRFELSDGKVVEDVYAVGQNPRTDEPKAIPETGNYGSTADGGKVGVEIRATPEKTDRDPDLEVCQFCEEEFR